MLEFIMVPAIYVYKFEQSHITGTLLKSQRILTEELVTDLSETLKGIVS